MIRTSHKSRHPFKLILGTIMIVLWMCSCSQSHMTGPVDQENQDMSDIQTVYTNTQLQSGDLRVGSGNFWEEEYKDENGKTVKGPTARIYLSHRLHQDGDEDLRIHAGQTITYFDYTISIVAIGSDSRGKYLQMKIIQQASQ